MSPTQKKRLWIILVLVMGISGAVGSILWALSHNINFFFTPTDVAQQQAPFDRPIRIGGMVKAGSFQRENALKVSFVITDFNAELVVNYNGILPDLFREGQGIVAQGQLNAQGKFTASQVLAKHDEKYMPPEVAQSLNRQALSKSLSNKNAL